MAVRLALLVPLMMLGACGTPDDADAGGISAREAQELNEAAEMLDVNSVDANALPPAGDE